ncbi:TPA: RHS repeat domain-containing protein [Neisseria subflava]
MPVPNTASTSPYDTDNNLTAVTDPEGRHWLRQYDANGNMILETDPEENETHYRYKATAHTIAMTQGAIPRL